MKQRGDSNRQKAYQARQVAIVTKYDTLRRIFPDASNQQLIIQISAEMLFDPATVRKALYAHGKVQPRLRKEAV